METKPTKEQIVALLDAWIRQRPGLEFANYGDLSAYRSELRSITKDGTEAKQLLRYVAGRDSITADMLLEGFRAYSGRLSIAPGKKPGTWRLDYCTGQYWPTEYRRAACAVLASAVWAHLRDECMPAPIRYDVQTSRWNGSRWVNETRASFADREAAEDDARIATRNAHDAWHCAGRAGSFDAWHVSPVYPRNESAGDYLRRAARLELGASIARRWFR